MENWLSQNFGVDANNFKFMLESNPSLNEVALSKAEKVVNLLKVMGCDKHLIKNIITSNALILSRSVSDLKKIISKLQQIGLVDIAVLLDANPYILNLDAYEIEKYIEKRKAAGESLDKIVDDLESNPANFLEI